MQLTARRHGQLITVHQEGGYGPESRIILRSVAAQSECRDGVTWYYPDSPATLISLHQASTLLDAELSWGDDLAAEFERVQNRLRDEQALRKLMQRYIDDKTLPLAPYTTAESPRPWHHQQVAYHWGLRIPAFYLAHKPGLGKTREGADIIRGRVETGAVRRPETFSLPDRYSDVFPSRVLRARQAIRGGILVVCPKVVQGTWYDELLNWQNIQGLVISSSGGRAAKSYRAGLPYWVHICSYGSLESLEGNQYDGIIADELHCCANEDSKRSLRMNYLREHAQWVVGLSGTPVSNMLPSLWQQYYWLDRGLTLGSSMEEYKRRYFTGTNRKMEATETAAAAIARQVSRITYFCTMQEAFPEKVPPIAQTQRIEMTDEQIHYYEKVRKDALADIHAGTVSAPSMITKLTKLAQIVQGFVVDDNKKVITFSSAKLRALRNMIDPAKGGDLSDRRCLIWVNWRPDMARVTELLQRLRIPTMTLHGDTEDREWVRDTWNSDHRYRVLVGMISMGIGINLNAPECVDGAGTPQRCSTALFYGYGWHVTQLEQAQDRVNRGNQVETCLFRYLVSEPYAIGSTEMVKPMDLRVFETLQDKLKGAATLSEDSVAYVRRLLGEAA